MAKEVEDIAPFELMPHLLIKLPIKPEFPAFKLRFPHFAHGVNIEWPDIELDRDVVEDESACFEVEEERFYQVVLGYMSGETAAVFAEVEPAQDADQRCVRTTLFAVVCVSQLEQFSHRSRHFHLSSQNTLAFTLHLHFLLFQYDLVVGDNHSDQITNQLSELLLAKNVPQFGLDVADNHLKRPLALQILLYTVSNEQIDLYFRVKKR
jgi:hypothetical protein